MLARAKNITTTTEERDKCIASRAALVTRRDKSDRRRSGQRDGGRSRQRLSINDLFRTTFDDRPNACFAVRFWTGIAFGWWWWWWWCAIIPFSLHKARCHRRRLRLTVTSCRRLKTAAVRAVFLHFIESPQVSRREVKCEMKRVREKRVKKISLC